MYLLGEEQKEEQQVVLLTIPSNVTEGVAQSTKKYPVKPAKPNTNPFLTLLILCLQISRYFGLWPLLQRNLKPKHLCTRDPQL